MTKKELLNKYQVEKDFHEWLIGFPDNTKFDISIKWESSLCVQMPYTKEKNLHKTQTQIG
jgi:hypothetical protein